MVKVLPRQIKCRSMLEAEGYSRSGASALVGNFCQEVGADLPTAFRTGTLDHGSQGLAQWRLTRLVNYEAFVEQQKRDLVSPGEVSQAAVDKVLWPWYGRMDFQTQFVAAELKADYPELDAKLRKGGDVATLTADVCWQYERPNKELSGIADRIEYAKAIAAYSDGTATPEPVASTSVVDKLHNTAAGHEQQATGGYVAAAGAGLGGIALVVSNFVSSVPTWELVVLGVLLFIIVAGVLTHITQARAATNVRAAIPGVSNVPKPKDPEPIVPSPKAPLPSTDMTDARNDPNTVVTSPEAIQALINSAVGKALADQVAKQNTQVQQPLPASVTQMQTGATFSVGQAKE